jgi:hypothetical protein
MVISERSRLENCHSKRSPLNNCHSERSEESPHFVRCATINICLQNALTARGASQVLKGHGFSRAVTGAK